MYKEVEGEAPEGGTTIITCFLPRLSCSLSTCRSPVRFFRSPTLRLTKRRQDRHRPFHRSRPDSDPHPLDKQHVRRSRYRNQCERNEGRRIGGQEEEGTLPCSSRSSTFPLLTLCLCSASRRVASRRASSFAATGAFPSFLSFPTFELIRLLLHSGTVDSPEWRKGPEGPKSLCNACGLRYAKLVSKSKKEAKEAAAKR